MTKPTRRPRKKKSDAEVDAKGAREVPVLAPDIEVLDGESDIVLNVPEVLAPEDAEHVESELPFEPPDADDADDSSPSTARGIVPYNPLSVYLREASRHPPLTREEEREIAISYFKNKDMESAYKLVVSNLWLVIKLAREYERAARNQLDLIQEGNIGLMEAVKNFDPYRGVRFPSYAVWWVKAYIIRYIIANLRLVKLGTTQAQRKLFFNLKKEKDRLEREGFIPAPKLLAEKLNVKEDEVVEMEQRLGSSDLSVDAPLQDGTENTLHTLLPSEGLSAEENYAKKEMQNLILKSFDEFSETLNEKERVIFRERMLGDDKVTLQDISDKLSVSRERVRQIENKLREKLKAFLSERLGPDATDEMKF